MCVTDPSTETGTRDYRLDPVEEPKHHPVAVKRLSGEAEVPTRLGPKHYGRKPPGR